MLCKPISRLHLTLQLWSRVKRPSYMPPKTCVISLRMPLRNLTIMSSIDISSIKTFQGWRSPVIFAKPGRITYIRECRPDVPVLVPLLDCVVVLPSSAQELPKLISKTQSHMKGRAHPWKAATACRQRGSSFILALSGASVCIYLYLPEAKRTNDRIQYLNLHDLTRFPWLDPTVPCLLSYYLLDILIYEHCTENFMPSMLILTYTSVTKISTTCYELCTKCLLQTMAGQANGLTTVHGHSSQAMAGSSMMGNNCLLVSNQE